MNTSMPKFIGITELRAKTRDVFDMVKNQEQVVVVMRESKPEAIIIPYKEFEVLLAEKRRLWNKRLDELAEMAKPYMKKWLKRKGFIPQKVTGDKLVEILEQNDKSSS